jgi:hypothetical protein
MRERKFVMGGYKDYEYRDVMATAFAGASFNDFHGCDILLHGTSTVYHESRIGNTTTPTIRSYKDGLKVGCTFINNNTLELLYKWHKDFILCGDTKTHQ